LEKFDSSAAAGTISVAADPARVFLNTDRALLTDLGYLREEWK
jgi:hypothetical protein